MKKIKVAAACVLGLGFAFSASAHVVVKPSEAGIGSFQTFAIGVPTEKDVPTIAVKLLLPAGLQEVTPTVKAGWKVNVKETGTGESAQATEIDWTNGSIPSDERDEFTFSAQVPSAPANLEWKAYQTYADGSVVAWDQDPSQVPAGEEGTPFSVTKVVDDLSATTTGAAPRSYDSTALTISIAALAISLAALMAARKRNQ